EGRQAALPSRSQTPFGNALSAKLRFAHAVKSQKPRETEFREQRVPKQSLGTRNVLIEDLDSIMPFLGPWFLMGMLGLAGAAIPIILHFFFRSRYRIVAWAAMEFLLTSIEQTSRRLKFQELLLLILRCALLLLLAVALARPALSLVGGGGRDA